MLTIATPEHVEIGLVPAGLGSRFLAITIDSLITLALSLLVARFAFVILPPGVALAVFVTASFVLTWGWHIYFETRHQGRTPGKRAISLRVVDARGLPVSLHQALVRNITRVLDFAPLFYGVGGLMSLVDERRRRFGDLLADTLVIRETRPRAYRGQLASERRFNTLRTPQVQRLIRHRIGLEEREFLLSLCLTSEKMNAIARYDLMEEVAAAYREKLNIEEGSLSGENFVRDLTAVVFGDRTDKARGRKVRA
ncbi:MAG TPA: RDD family protein [Thermoanaerobaculia bacterium]|nr:RDD family protein [Thermoanaerobaculia bacterium]